MTRLKFFVFVLVCLGLAAGGLVQLSELMAASGQAAALEKLGGGRALLEAGGKLAQSYRTVALQSAAAAPELGQAAAGALEAPPAPAAEAAVKAVKAALQLLPEAIRTPAFILVSNGRGVALVAADGAVSTPEVGVWPVGAAVQNGPRGAHALVDGKLYQVAAAPIRVISEGAEKTVGTLAAAFPLDDAWAAAQDKATGVRVSLVAGGAALASSLSASDRARVGTLKDGAFELGAPPALGPVKLPLKWPSTKPLARHQAAAFPLEGVEGAQVVLVAEAAPVVALAHLQARALIGLGGFLVLALAFLLLMGSPAKASAAEVPEKKPAKQAEAKAAPEAQPATPAPQPAEAVTAPEPLAQPAGQASPQTAADAAAAQASDLAAIIGGEATLPGPAPVAPEPQPAFAAGPAPEAPAEPPQATPAIPELEPEPAGQPAAPAFAPAPTSPFDDPATPMAVGPLPSEPAHAASSDESPFDPFGPAPQAAPTSAPAPAAPAAEAYDTDEAPTRVRPVAELIAQAAATAAPPFDPFAEANAAAPQPAAEEDAHQEPTVVAPVSDQLLRATSRRPTLVPPPAAAPAPAPAPSPAPVQRAAAAAPAAAKPAPAPAPAAAAPKPDAEEAHFLEVFNQFVATRAQCAEPADGLTFDKFAAKLRKNKEQLVQKYACKSVRFQVYVKDGKAALKATPLKD